ncbi:hypothetical protein [Haloarcula pelagica]|uniref:hypothetical protein n=1 Tax=Halomicroarcula sp. GCM10025709 TaxID=3252669 RepID=UPI0036D2A482
MTTAIARIVTAFVLLTLVLASTAGPIGAETTTAPAQQEPMTTELSLQAALTGDLVVVAGWFQLTGTAEGRLDTSTGASDLDGTFDVGPAVPFGEFAYRGEVVGTVNASRVLFAFEGNATTLRGEEPAAQPTTSSGAVDTPRDAGPARAAAVPIAPGQLSPFRWQDLLHRRLLAARDTPPGARGGRCPAAIFAASGRPECR